MEKKKNKYRIIGDELVLCKKLARMEKRNQPKKMKHTYTHTHRQRFYAYKSEKESKRKRTNEQRE